MKCNKCKYEWDCKSKLANVSCPSCLQKVPNTDIKENDNNKK